MSDKDELKTVVREFLASRNQIAMKPSQRFGKPTVECPQLGDVRKYASAEERAANNQKTTVAHFGFTEKVYGLPCSFAHCYCINTIIEMSSWEFRFLRRVIAVEARRRQAASASVCIYLHIYVCMHVCMYVCVYVCMYTVGFHMLVLTKRPFCISLSMF